MRRIHTCYSLWSLAVCMSLASAATAADWPQWRGPQRDGVSAETGLLRQWPADGPSLRWKSEDLGDGYSSPSVLAGRVFLQTNKGGDEFAVALDEKSGRQLWSVKIGKVGRNRGPQYPGTRSTPTTDGDLIYCLASDGELVCLESKTGKQRWQKHLRNDFGGTPGSWAYSESVLVDGNMLICTPGGAKATIAALNKTNGDVIWTSPVPGGDNAEYASIVSLGSTGNKQYVQFLRKGLVGVDAATGKYLWRYARTIDPGANILTPIVQGTHIFSAGSRTGGGVIRIQSRGGETTAEEAYFQRKLTPSIGGAVLVDGHLYGTTRQALFCAEFDSGKTLWTDRAVGAASICYADGHLYVRGHKDGQTLLVEATPKEYREKGRLKQPQRSKVQAWPHPVIANGGLYLRDQGRLFCYQVAAEKEPVAANTAK